VTLQVDVGSRSIFLLNSEANRGARFPGENFVVRQKRFRPTGGRFAHLVTYLGDALRKRQAIDAGDNHPCLDARARSLRVRFHAYDDRFSVHFADTQAGRGRLQFACPCAFGRVAEARMGVVQGARHLFQGPV
jgi:hypothetical protein